MRVKLRVVLRGSAVALLALLLWSVWASAQTATDTSNTNTLVSPSGGLSLGSTALREEVKAHRDYMTFGLERVPFLRDHNLLGQPLWKYVASLVYLIAAFYLARLLDFLANAWLKRWLARTGTQFTDLFVHLLRGPIRVVTFVVFLNVGLDLFDWGLPAQNYLTTGFILIVAASLTYVALKCIDLLIGVWRQRTAAGSDRSFDEQLFPVVTKSLKIFTVVAAVLVTASNLHINITGALASLSVGALAVGLAAQDTLANLFGAIAVYIDKPFRIGDRIQLDSVDGTVESIGLRSTRVRSLEGHHVTIPNKTVGNATITNVTRRPNIKTELNFGLPYDTSADQLRRVLKSLEEIYRAHPKTADLVICFNRFTESWLNIQVIHWWNGTDGRAQLIDLQALNLQVKERFESEGIRLAHPARSVYLRQTNASAETGGG